MIQQNVSTVCSAALRNGSSATGPWNPMDTVCITVSYIVMIFSSALSNHKSLLILDRFYVYRLTIMFVIICILLVFLCIYFALYLIDILLHCIKAL